MRTTDTNIGSLQKATHLDADSLLVAEQQGEAVAVEGALFMDFARQAVAQDIEKATAMATRAETSATDAEKSALQARDSVNRIENMGVQATTLPSDRMATVEKQSGVDAVKLIFGIPRGKDGYTPQKGVDYFDGKSAYQYAVDSGYAGTEKDFMAKLAAEAGIFYVADGGTPSSVDTQVFDGGTPFTTDDIKLDGGTP